MDDNKMIPQIIARNGEWLLISIRHDEFNDLAMAVKTNKKEFSDAMMIGSWLKFNPYWDLIKIKPANFEVPKHVYDKLMMTPQQFMESNNRT